jgi:hypothetical protein
MPVPQGQITSSEGWTTPEVVVPEEPTTVEEQEEIREEALDVKPKRKKKAE